MSELTINGVGLLAKEWSRLREQLLNSDHAELYNIELARQMFYRGARVATAASLRHSMLTLMLASEIRQAELETLGMLEVARSGGLQ